MNHIKGFLDEKTLNLELKTKKDWETVITKSQEKYVKILVSPDKLLGMDSLWNLLLNIPNESNANQ